MEARERRRSFRIEVDATAALWERGAFHGSYPVLDLSLGGCCLSACPTTTLGKQLELCLRPPDREQELRMPVRVARRHESSLGLQFLVHDPLMEDWVHDLLMQSLEQSPLPLGRTLVVHSRPEEISELLTTLEGHGHHVNLVCTPLEMVWMLENREGEFHTAVISPSLVQVHKLDVTGFLARRHPSMQHVILEVGEDGHEHLPRGQAHLLRAACNQAPRLRSLRKVSPGLGAKKKRAQGGPASS